MESSFQAREGNMETATMGQVIVPAKIESIFDLYEESTGKRSADQVRRVEVSNAQVDTGAAMLFMPKRLIEQLGLTPFTTRHMRTTGGIRECKVYGPVKLTVQERYCNTDVGEIPDDCPVLIGQVPLELLDFVVDCSGRRLVGNPAHNGEWMIDAFRGS
jgi:predicted aspartyl protease